MGSPMTQTEFTRLIEDATLAPRQRLKEFGVCPNELPGPCFRRSIDRIEEMITLRREVGDPFLGVVLEDISRTIGPQRIGMYAESDEGESHLNQALTPNAFEFVQRRRRIARGGEGNHLGADEVLAHATRRIAGFEKRITCLCCLN